MLRRSLILFSVLLCTVLLYARPAQDLSEYRRVLEEAHSRADSLHGFDVLSYDVSIDIDQMEEYIDGIVIATILAEEDLEEITFELEALTVDEILVNGESTTFTHEDGEIDIALSDISNGDEFTVQISYFGYPQLSDDVFHIGMIFSQYYFFTLSDPSGVRWWMPAYDHPWEKAIYDFHITEHDDWVIACNGIRTGIDNNGDGTHTTHWEGSSPMAGHLACITAGYYIQIDDNYGDLPIQNFAVNTMYDEALEDFSNLPYMIEVYESVYGEYPFEKYGNAIVPMQTFGAMEHQTMTTMGSSFIDGNHGGEITIAHELSHQWFGNCVTPLTFDHVWLSEGFAVLSEAIYMEHWQGFDEMTNYVDSAIHGYYINWANSNGSRTIYAPPYNETFSPPVYEKAASVLHMLRLIMGDDDFFDAVQTYFQTYRNGWAVTEELRAIMEQESGLDLGQFFDQWIYSPGLPATEYALFFAGIGSNSPQMMSMVQTVSNTSTDFHIQVPIHVNWEEHHDSLLVTGSPDAPAMQVSDLTGIGDFTAEFDPHHWVISRSNTEQVMTLLNASATDGEVIVYWQPFWEAAEVEGYNVYRSEEEDQGFTLLNDDPATGTIYNDENVSNGQTYYYYVTAVKDGFESLPSQTLEATPIDFPMDQGVLVIDETRNGSGTPGNPDDAQVDDFYTDVINNFFTSHDLDTDGDPQILELRNYSTIIWHDDDITQQKISDYEDILTSYLLAGGNLIVSGWKTATELSESFRSTFLNITEASFSSSAEFSQALSDNYPNQTLDQDKILSVWNGMLPYVCVFEGAEDGIYTFHSEAGSDYEGLPCALKYQPSGTVFFFGFPLYYMQKEMVESLFDRMLSDLGEEVSIETETIQQPSIQLTVFPNPVQAADGLSVSFSLPKPEKIEAAIYNVRGQLVTRISQGNYDAGVHSLYWDGLDETGKVISSGVYFLRLETPSQSQTKKVLILR